MPGFNDDMIAVTGNACASIVLRNAVFKGMASGRGGGLGRLAWALPLAATEAPAAALAVEALAVEALTVRALAVGA